MTNPPGKSRGSLHEGGTASSVTAQGLSDKAEPTTTRTGVPVAFIVVLGLLLYWGDMYVMENGADLMGKTGSFPAQVYFPFRTFKEVKGANPQTDEDLSREVGKRVFGACAQCHQANGEGNRGLNFPPLVGSEWVLAEGPNRIIRIVLHGLTGSISVKAEQYNNSMASLGSFSDEEIAAVLSYVRNEWGNKAEPVKPEQVKTIRAATSDRVNMWTVDELMQIPVK